MLYIINIDDCSWGMSSVSANVADITASFSKNYSAMATDAVGSATNGLVSIKNKDDQTSLISSKKPSEITLDGTVYSSTYSFVQAFNNLMAECGASVTATVDFTDVTDKLQEVIDCVCRDCSSWSIGTVDNVSTTLSAGAINSCTIIVETGDVTVSNGSESATLATGQSITFEAENALTEDIIIDATGGGKAHYVTTSCASPR